jgi:hypothetical protein
MATQNYIDKLEIAIKQKYGEEAIRNPKADWDKEKEKEFLHQLKEFYNDQTEIEEPFINHNNILLSPKLFRQRKMINKCSKCLKFSICPGDDLFLLKFKVCKACYHDFVEGREQEWKSRQQNEQ